MALIASIAAGSADNVTVTTGAINTTGATLLVMSLATYQGTALPTVSDSKTNTWTPLTNHEIAGNNRSTILYVANPVVGSGHTFTATLGASYPGISVAAFDGVATTTPFDQQNGATVASGQTGQSGSITPTANGELLIAAIAQENAGNTDATLSINAGFTKAAGVDPVGGQHYGTTLAYFMQTTAAAINPAWTWNTVSSAALGIASFTVSRYAVLTGTAVGGITEADVVTGGKTILITLTGDTWIPN